MASYPDIAKGIPVIYGIRLSYDPFMEFRYVGMTIEGSKRFRKHLADAHNPNTPTYHYERSRWIRKHHSQVTFEVLEYVDEEGLLPNQEKKWIHILRSRGYRLSNQTDGGEGMSGWKHTRESRAKQSEAQRGKKFSEERRAAHSAAHIGKRHTDSAKAKMSASQMGNKNCLGRTLSSESRAKIAAANVGNTNGAKGKHTRWHTNRGITNPSCSYCIT